MEIYLNSISKNRVHTRFLDILYPRLLLRCCRESRPELNGICTHAAVRVLLAGNRNLLAYRHILNTALRALHHTRRGREEDDFGAAIADLHRDAFCILRKHLAPRESPAEAHYTARAPRARTDTAVRSLHHAAELTIARGRRRFLAVTHAAEKEHYTDDCRTHAAQNMFRMMFHLLY